jgi:hypothetical protein
MPALPRNDPVSEVRRHLLRVERLRCLRTVEIQKADALRLARRLESRRHASVGQHMPAPHRAA